MKIQIWGKSKCFDTKKAERYFKERRIPYQAIDLLRYGMSRGELTSVKNAVGLDAMLNPKAADYALVQHLAYEQDKIERLLEDPSLLQTPIVRNGRQATVGAVFTEQGVDLALFELQGDVVVGLDARELLGDVKHFDHIRRSVVHTATYFPISVSVLAYRQPPDGEPRCPAREMALLMF